MLADGVVKRIRDAFRSIGRAKRPQDLAAGSDEGDPPVVATQASPPHPSDFAECTQLIEQARLVARDAGRQDVPLQDRRRDRQAGQLVDDLGQPLQGGRAAQGRQRRADRRDALPGQEEAGQCRGIDRLHLAPQTCQRPAPQQSQDLLIAPFTLGATGPELAAQHGPSRQQPLQGVAHDAGRQPPPSRRTGRQERPVGPGPTCQEAIQRPGDRPQEGGRHSDRWRDPDAIAIAADILDRDPALIARDAGPDRASSAGKLVEPRFSARRAALRPRGDLRGAQVAEPPQEIVDAVERRRPPVLRERLESQLEIGQGIGVEELAQFLLTQQFAQQVAVQGQRTGPSLGQRRVAVVHVGGDVVEQEAAGERRCVGGLHRMDRDLATRHAAQDLAERRQIEDVGQAFAVGLDKDRETAVARRHGQQVRRTLALLPQRRARPGSSAREEQGAGRVLPEVAREERRSRQLADDEIFDLLRVGE